MRFVLVFVISLLSFLNSLASEIKGNWKFPSDIAVENGKVYVVDGLNNRIAVYNAEGKHLFDVKLPSPFGIYVGKESIFVTSGEGKVYVLDKSSKLLKEFKVEGRPIDIVKVKDKLFISNGKTNTIDVYSLDGRLLKKIGGKGSAPGYFIGPFMMDTSGKVVFVVDTVNGRIQEFDSKGKFLRAFGKFGVEEGDIFRPKGIAYCNGDIVVSDAITGAVQVFNVYGGFETVVVKNLYYPTAVACYDGKVFVLEPLKKRISTFRIQGVK